MDKIVSGEADAEVVLPTGEDVPIEQLVIKLNTGSNHCKAPKQA
jgi:hypothetical protein